MVVNVDKTEAVVFSRNKLDPVRIDIGNSSFITTQSMKVLGVLFDSQLKWSPQAEKAIATAKRSLYGLRILRRNLGSVGFTKILTAQFFSKLYYGAAVWLQHLSCRDMMRIESLHYSALRVGCYDFHNKIPRHILDHDFKRATPREWARYCISREYIRVYTSQSPKALFEMLDRQVYHTNRPLMLRFYDNSKKQVGRQTFANTVSQVSKDVQFDWFYTRLSPDQLRIKLKECLFKYPSVSSSFHVPGELSRQILQHRLLKKNHEMPSEENQHTNEVTQPT